MPGEPAAHAVGHRLVPDRAAEDALTASAAPATRERGEREPQRAGEAEDDDRGAPAGRREHDRAAVAVRRAASSRSPATARARPPAAPRRAGRRPRRRRGAAR